MGARKPEEDFFDKDAHKPGEFEKLQQEFDNHVERVVQTYTKHEIAVLYLNLWYERKRQNNN